MSFGLPWFNAHNPKINWAKKTLTLKSEQCKDTCFLLLPETVKLISALELPPSTPAISRKVAVIPSSPGATSVPPELSEFSDVFRRPKGEDVAEHSKYDHKFELFDDKDLPPHKGIYALSPSEKDILKNYIDEALLCGWISPSKSPIAAPIFFVPKKDGSLRPCVDYRALNARTKKNRFPLPLISELFSRLSSKRKFSKIDLRNAFHQVRIFPGQEWLTAFRCFLGHFQYNVMPFGLTNAPAMLQSMMNDKFADMSDFVMVYLDDILIFSENPDDHLQHVKDVLLRLRENRLLAKLDKCFFFMDSVEFLGFIISKDGVSLALDKLAKIRDWPLPQNQAELRSFLGFCNYYRNSLRGYSDLATPLTTLTKKSFAKFEWTNELKACFESLKLAIINAPTRQHPDPDKVFILETDASDFALAAVLLQTNEEGNLLPVLFHSRKFNPAERNYSVYDKELLAIVEAFTTWRHYLITATDPIKIYTDHSNLIYFSRRRPLTPRHSRWVQIISSFQFVITYRPGHLNVLADPLSRHPSYALTPEEKAELNLLTVIPESKFKEFPKEAFDLFKEISARSAKISDPSDSKLNPIPDPEEEALKRAIVTDPLVRLKILQSRHDSPLGGHFGQTRTFELISRDFVWDNLRKDVKNFVASCEICQRTKKARHLPYGLLMPLSPPKMPWTDISLDFIVGLPESAGYDSVLVVVDRFTKMAHFIPCTEKTDAMETAMLLIHYVFKLHGLPTSILSDRGPQFKAKLWRAVLTAYKITRKLSTAYHPETDGQTERTNQTLEGYLRCYTNYNQDDWFHLLPMAEFAYNNSPNSRGSPFFLNYGYHPRMDFLSKSVPPGVPAYLDPQKLAKIRETAHELLLRAAEDLKKYADRHRKDITFHVGQKVYLSTKNLSTDRPSKKLDYKKIGPYTITQKINDVAFKVKLPKSMKIHPVFHVSLLEPAQSDPNPKRKQVQPPPVTINSESEYTVETVLKSRIHYNKLQYLVKWVGWTDPTWEPAIFLQNSPRLISIFHAKNPQSPGPLPLRG
jgi:hypothetical protein